MIPPHVWLGGMPPSTRDGYGEPDPADETSQTGAEYESRTRLKLTSAAGRAELLAEAEKGAGAYYPEWLRSELGLCIVCERPNYDMDRRTCELHRDPIFESEPE